MKAENLVSQFHSQAMRRGDAHAFRYKRGPKWHWVSWKRWREHAEAVAAALLSMGLEQGEPVGILSRNSGPGLILDLGILMAGGVPTPIPSGLAEAELKHVLGHAGARFLAVENPYRLRRLLTLHHGQMPFDKVILMEDQASVPDGDREAGALTLGEALGGLEPTWLVTFEEFLLHGEEQLERFGPRLDALQRHGLTPKSPAMLLYTSGTTGVPKGVLLSHGNFLFELERLQEALPIGAEDEQLLFLPLSHVLGQVVCKSIWFTGSRLALGEGVPHILDNIHDVDPTYVATVPSFLEKLVHRVNAMLREQGGLSTALFDWACDVSRRQRTREARPESLVETLVERGKFLVADQLVLKESRAVLGGRMRLLICGGAHLPRHVGEFLHSLGVTVVEGYGLTETTAATHLNRPEGPRFGTVGPALRGVECRLGPDGEVQIRGDNVMLGYHRDQAATREAFTEDGWLRTGDQGVLDADGVLTVTGKLKALIVLSNGRNVPPARVEDRLRRSPYLSQVLVFGDNRPYLVALVVLDEEKVRACARERHWSAATLEELVSSPDVFRLVERELEQQMRDLPEAERVKRFAILPRPLSVEEGELTETQKPRRDAVFHRHKALIDSFYL
jgi:long-chain acyl-CoA synthetase